jgi:hypothetical protein
MSYLPKVMRPITIIGTIDPKKEYTTTEAVRVVSCGPHTLIQCAMAGDMPAKQVVEKGRWRFVGADLIDLVTKHAQIVEQLAAKRKENARAQQREWRRRNAEKVKKQQQQQLPMSGNAPSREQLLAEIDRLREAVANMV